MSSPELKRVLTLPTVIFIAVGFMIGGGVFVFTGIVFRITGPSLPLAYVLAAVPVFISMLPLAMLGAAIPATGANYKYPSRMISPGLAFVGVWIYALAAFFGQIPLFALGCANYAQGLFPQLSPTVFAIALITFFFVINLLGVNLAAQIQGLLVILLIAALIFYAIGGMADLDWRRFDGLFQKGAGNLMLGTALLTFTYFGANGIIELGGEIINPSKVIPRAFLVAFPVVLLIYAAVAFATVGAAPGAILNDAAEPLIQISRLTIGKAGSVFFIICGAIVALTTTLNALFIVGTKSLLIMAQDQLLPASLGSLNKRFGTPHILLAIVWILSILGIVSGFSLDTFASFAALGGLIIFLPVQIASLRLPHLFPVHYRRSPFKLSGFWRWFCPAVGVFMVLFFGLLILFDLKSALKTGWFLAFIASGFIYYTLRKRHLHARGIRIEALRECNGEWDG